MAQVKEHNKIPEEEQNKMEGNNLLDAQLKILVIRLLKKLRTRTDELRENFNKCRTSVQDGGVGRHTVPPRTTKRRTTTM